jgi:Pyridoxamine 5'-phosphate oxidase
VGKDTTQISEPIAKLLEGRNFAFVATLKKDGWPQITPTWVWLQLMYELEEYLKIPSRMDYFSLHGLRNLANVHRYYLSIGLILTVLYKAAII